MNDDYKQLILERMLSLDTFVRAAFSGQQKGATLKWVRVAARPVEVKGEVRLQVSYFDEKKDVTKNYSRDEAADKIRELLSLPFRNIFVEDNASRLQVNISKKGKAIVSESKSAAVVADLAHNRQKNRVLSPENATPFLEAIGVLTKDGKIKADAQRKYKQINDFIRLIDEADALEGFRGKPIHVVDFGCGSAYLTFALYYYLHEVLNLDARVTGVDIKSDLIERHQAKAKSLGWSQLTFQVGQISDYRPESAPDVVVALHACDTATDDALAQGIRWDSKLIVCAPCCQHELQGQLSRVQTPAPFIPVFNHGILFERAGDILTDSFRAAVLRIMGYRVDVTEFVPVEHTAKNLMIRAVKVSAEGNARWVEEYRNLKSFWGVAPYLERLLRDQYGRFL